MFDAVCLWVCCNRMFPEFYIPVLLILHTEPMYRVRSVGSPRSEQLEEPNGMRNLLRTGLRSGNHASIIVELESVQGGRDVLAQRYLKRECRLQLQMQCHSCRISAHSSAVQVRFIGT
jgi:hypothetical protein